MGLRNVWYWLAGYPDDELTVLFVNRTSNCACGREYEPGTSHGYMLMPGTPRWREQTAKAIDAVHGFILNHRRRRCPDCGASWD